MPSVKPQLNKIDRYKFFNLYERNWKIDASESSIKFNKPILERIASDFSEFTEIEHSLIMRIFGRYILGESAENILLLYTNKHSDNVFFYFTHSYSDIYEILNPE